MQSLGRIKDDVIYILENYPEARDSNDVLIATYDKLFCTAPVGASHYEIQINRRFYNLPTTDSIGRAKRKALETRPDLRGSRASRKRRRELQEVYREFARDER